MLVNEQDFEKLLESMYPDYVKSKERASAYFQNKIDNNECEVYVSPQNL